MSSLEINALTVNRGALPVVRDVSLKVDKSSISVLLGANGAGKTTLLEAVSGIIPVTGGDIVFDGHPVQKQTAGHRARGGLIHIEEGRSVFKTLTTRENLAVACHPDASVDEAFELFPELKQREHIAGGLLSGGEQQMLTIARAILCRPKVLLIDEMSAGLAPVIVQRLMAAVRQLADDGLAILLVEQFAMLALGVADRAYVLRRGSVVYDGEPQPLLDEPERLHHLYLGDTEIA